MNWIFYPFLPHADRTLDEVMHIFLLCKIPGMSSIPSTNDKFTTIEKTCSSQLGWGIRIMGKNARSKGKRMWFILYSDIIEDFTVGRRDGNNLATMPLVYMPVAPHTNRSCILRKRNTSHPPIGSFECQMVSKAST